jgi:hypothetical protein
MVAVNADALVRLTRAVLPAISPAPAPDSRSGPTNAQQLRIALRAKFVLSDVLGYRGGQVQSILLGRNIFRTSLMDILYYP